MKPKKKNLVIIIFPYLFIDKKEGMNIDNKVTLKPSYTDLVNEEESLIKDELLNIVKLFRYGRDEQIFKWSYIISHIGSLKEWKILQDKLDQFRNLAMFINFTKRTSSEKFNQFNYFMFEITKFYDKSDLYNYYSALLNGESTYNFYFKDNEIENPYNPNQIYPIVLYKNEIIDNPYFVNLNSVSDILFSPREREKILRAIEWFNRSFSHIGQGLDQSESILNIHTAIEALLRPADEKSGVRVQVKTAMQVLLGNSENLNNWLEEFYKLRNSIAHGDSRKPSIMYVHPEGKKGFRSHLYIAREIFIKLLNSIFKVRTEFPLIGLEEKLFSNELRIKKAIKILSKSKKKKLIHLYNSGIFSLISSLAQDELSATKEESKKLGEYLLPLVLNDLDSITEQKREEITKLVNIILTKKEEFNLLALKYSNLEKLYSEIYFNKDYKNIETLALRSAAYHYFNYMTWRLLTFIDS